MASVKYTYSVSQDFTGLVSPYTKPNLDLLEYTIRASEIITALDFIGLTGDTCDIWFKATLMSGDETLLDGIVAAHTGVPMTEQEMLFDSDGNILVSNHPMQGVEKNFYMPNMCDECSWYEGSEEVSNESLTDSGDGKTWNGPEDDKWIDLFHHRVHGEAKLDRDGFKPVIEVSDDAGSTWTPVDECHQAWDQATQEYDYTEIPADEVFIHYSTSKVVFGSSQAGNLVRASYYKADGFRFTVAPAAGKKLQIVYAEVQGSFDLAFTCTVDFNIYIEGIPVPVGGAKYGTMWNYVAESKGNFPTVPAIGGDYKYGEVFRGMQKGAIVQPFPYLTTQNLLSSMGMSLVVEFSEGDGPWGGEFGNGTFYCLVEDE